MNEIMYSSESEKLPEKMIGNLIEIPSMDKIKDINTNIKLLDLAGGLPDTVNILLFANDVDKQKKYGTVEKYFMAIFSPFGEKERDTWTDYFVRRHDLRLIDKIEAEKL